jgi:uncharacterized small protein (DUF1192 family)
MTLPSDPRSSHAETASAGGERRRIGRERLLDEVRRLEQAEQFAAALQAIRDSGLTSTDAASLQPEIARLKQAARLQALYQRARAALQAGDEEAARLLSAVVAVEPGYKDAAKLLYERLSGVSVADLEARIAASQEAASRVEAERDRLARGRARLVWVAGAQGVILCLLVGGTAWRGAPPGAADGRARPGPSGGAQVARPAPPASPEALTPVPAASTTQAGAASGAAAPAVTTSSREGPPPELDGPCRSIGASCSSTVQCCVGSVCSGTTCQDARKTIVFGQYRP